MLNKTSIRCLVTDDEPLALQLIGDYINKTPGLELVHATTSAIDALQWVQEGRVELVFLDIQMPELTGLQFMKIVRSQCRFILTTAYVEYALDGYEFDVIDYLLKPVTYDRFLVAVNKAKERAKPVAVNQLPVEPVPDYLFVKTEYRLQKVNLADILYLEGMRDYVSIHTTTEKIMTLQPMRHFEETLPAEDFVRIHKSFLIAIEKISFLEKNRVVINNRHLPVGDAYRNAFWEKIKTV